MRERREQWILIAWQLGHQQVCVRLNSISALQLACNGVDVKEHSSLNQQPSVLGIRVVTTDVAMQDEEEKEHGPCHPTALMSEGAAARIPRLLRHLAV